MDASLENISEKELQKIVHSILSDPSIIRKTIKGKRLQILSPGRINVDLGPDFLDTAIFIGGEIVVGDAEFHRRSSEWYEHNHQSNPAYNKLILHIVIEDNLQTPFDKEILIIDESELIQHINHNKKSVDKTCLAAIEDVQHFALLRLLRKTAEAQRIINKNGLTQGFEIILGEYLKNYFSRKKRPVYKLEELVELIELSKKSEQFRFLLDIENNKVALISDTLFRIMQIPIHKEGRHLRREIVLNCVLPLSLCIANEESRISLFQWYWSTSALTHYGKLKRSFPNFPQNYLWQQQGMLEYLREYGKKPNVISETIKDYGFAQILSFYRLGGIPIEPLLEE